jgi:hypothetical protein
MPWLLLLLLLLLRHPPRRRQRADICAALTARWYEKEREKRVKPCVSA